MSKKLEFKGTKGEWKTQADHGHFPELDKNHLTVSVRIINNDGYSLLHTIADLRRKSINISMEEAKANAKLIAAAPDLLDAAIQVVNGWDHPDNCGEMWIPDFCGEGVDNLKKAIEKALK